MIRSWNENDISQITDLIKELNKELNEDFEIDVERAKKQYKSMIEFPSIHENYVFEYNGLVIGYISLLMYESIYHKKGTAQINELVVSENHRNRGIGKKLLEYAVKRAKEVGMDEIEVGAMKENKKAIKFYKDNGIDSEYLLLGMEFKG